MKPRRLAKALISAGIRIMEVPLNSPDPLQTIQRLARRFGSEASVGAGTVLAPADVQRVAQIGGELIVAPNVDVDVIAVAVAAAGFFTPTEGFRALAAGAHVLRLFPAEAAPPSVLKAQLAILPKDIPVLVVGAITQQNMGEYLAAGARGLGLGSGLYSAGGSAAEVGERARAYGAALPQALPRAHSHRSGL
jgi:2-dehydro-3-deoxyphosphogalactonate aldolase